MSVFNAIWQLDKLDRRGDADVLSTFLRKRSRALSDGGERRAFVLNLDCRWGEGKTYFLKQFQLHLEAQAHLAVYVDAWQDDIADYPLISVMAAIDEKLDKYREKETVVMDRWNTVRRAIVPVMKAGAYGAVLRAGQMLFTAAGTEAIVRAAQSSEDGGSPVSEEAATKSAGAISEASTAQVAKAIEKLAENKASDAIADFRAIRNAVEQFRKALEDFIIELEMRAGKAMPLYVLIDELDRCRPTYAISMLERVKHLFQTRNVVFVIATDTEQLVHSIGAAYGANFDAARYLHRFFDRTYSFQALSRHAFVEYVMEKNPPESDYLSFIPVNPVLLLRNVLSDPFFDLRTIEQIYDLVVTAVNVWREPVKLELVVLLPLAIEFQRRRRFPRYMENIFASSPAQNPPLLLATSHGLIINESYSIIGSRLWRYSENLRLIGGLDVPEDTIDEWAIERLAEEIEVRKLQLTPEGPPVEGLIRSYPRLIRAASMFKPNVQSNWLGREPSTSHGDN